MSIKIDAATRARVIDGAVAKLNEFYVFPETAKKMAEAVQARLKSGAYDAITDADDFRDQTHRQICGQSATTSIWA